MEQTNVQITQNQPTLVVEIVQNLIPVMTAQVVVGGGGSAQVVFGDTMTGTGTPSDPVNVSNDILAQLNDNSEQIADIQDVIPATANPQNQLADQGFVNSSIQTATAYFRGDWATWADVPTDPAQYPADATGNRTPITNDYMVVIADEQENGGTWRYKYTGVWATEGKSGWQAEYQVNETPFTAAQNAAINSGITAQAVADIATNKNAIAGKQDKLTAGPGITIEGNTISAGGDYLPLSGGTLTGGITFSSGSCQYSLNPTSWSELEVNMDGNTVFSVEPIGIVPEIYGIAKTLGRSSRVWSNVYTQKLNNGADIIVPAEGGTMARLEDINAAVGDISTALSAIIGE